MKKFATYSAAGFCTLAIAGLSAAALTLAAGGGPSPAAELGIMLQAGANGLCADNAGSARPGTAVQGWKCSPRNLNQRFVLLLRRGQKTAGLKNKLSGLCLDTGKGTKKPGAAVFQTRCGKLPNQSLEIVPAAARAGAKGVRLRARHNGLCLQLTGNTKRGGPAYPVPVRSKERQPDIQFQEMTALQPRHLRRGRCFSKQIDQGD